MTDGWRYYARHMNGDGTESKLHDELPLLEVKIDNDLSGPGGLKAKLGPEQAGLTKADGSSLFVPWATSIYAAKGPQIRGGGILANVKDSAGELNLDVVGFTGYAKDQPYTEDKSFVAEDPLNIVRHIWGHLQGKIGGNLGLVVDGTTSNMRIGKPLVEGVTAKDEGPFILGWWESHDLGKILDDLAVQTPFDYVLEHAWDGEKIVHRMRIGFPAIGRRRTDLRFVMGENIFQQPPDIDYEGEDFADEVLMLGAGEGRKMIRGIQGRPHSGRLRRLAVVEDKTLTSHEAAERAARDELSWRLGDPDYTSLIVSDHPSAPHGSYGPGDEIQVRTPEGWHKGLDLWVRILSISIDPQSGLETLSVTRSEKGNR